MGEDEARVLLAAAKQAPLSEADVERVSKALTDPSTTARRYTLLHIIGRAGGPRYRSLVEDHLDSPDDPMVARLALQILCRFWGLAGEYREVLRAFVAGVAWDDEDDVRQLAVFEAGELLELQDDSVLLNELLRLTSDGDGNPVLRDAAVRALARAVGVTPSDMPGASRLLPLRTEWEAEVLRKGKRRLAIGADG